MLRLQHPGSGRWFPHLCAPYEKSFQYHRSGDRLSVLSRHDLHHRRLPHCRRGPRRHHRRPEPRAPRARGGYRCRPGRGVPTAQVAPEAVGAVRGLPGLRFRRHRRLPSHADLQEHHRQAAARLPAPLRPGPGPVPQLYPRRLQLRVPRELVRARRLADLPQSQRHGRRRRGAGRWLPELPERPFLR